MIRSDRNRLKSLNLLFIQFMLLSAFQLNAAAISEEEARFWCDTNPLRAVEGIWEYPSDNTRVLIQADKNIPGAYSIIVLSTPDCRLDAGEIIGRLLPSADSSQFHLEQFTKKDNNILNNIFGCSAVLSSDGESIHVKSTKLKLKISPYTLLPKFWRLVRISVKNPSENLPAGLIKIYPGYDHNGSLRRNVRIL